MGYVLNPFTGEFDKIDKVAIGGTVKGGTEGSVLFVDSSGNLAQNNTNFFWDNTDDILKIAGVDPEIRLTDTGNNSYTRITKSDTTDTAQRINATIAVAYALGFTGSGDDYVNFTDPVGGELDDFDDFTFSFWIKAPAQTNKWILGKWRGSTGQAAYTMGADNSGTNKLRVRLSTTGSASGAYDVNSTATVFDNTYHHVVIRRTGTAIDYFIDNNKESKTTLSGTLASSTEPFLIGAVNTSVGTNADMTMDEAAIWKKSLSDNDVTDLYNSGNGLFIDSTQNFPTDGGSQGTNLVFLTHFDDGTGLTATDSSGNGNDGTLTNMVGDEWIADEKVVSTSFTERSVWKHLNTGLQVGDSTLQVDFTGTAFGFNNTSPTAFLDVVLPTAAQIGQIIKGAVSQTADIFQIVNSGDSELFTVDNSGNITATGNIIGPNVTSGTDPGHTHTQLHDAVTLSGENYLSLSGQQITANAINLTGSNVTGTLPLGSGGTGNTAFTAGSIIFSDGTKLTQDNSNLFYDNINNRLGIGVNSSILTPLHVQGLAGTGFLNENTQSTGSAFSSVWSSTRGGWFRQHAGLNPVLAWGNAQNLTFGEASNPASNPYDASLSVFTRMYIEGTSGYVGMGTSSPAAKLHVIPLATTDEGLIVQGAAGQSADLQQWQNSAGTDLVVVDNEGKVGIGTNAPSAKLTIAGTLSGDSETDNYLNISGTLPSATTANVYGTFINLESAGSGSKDQIALQVELTAGYTGTRSTSALGFQNFAAGTGIQGDVTNLANYGVFGLARGSTVGDNVGALGFAISGDHNYGVVGNAWIGKDNAKNVGVLGYGLNTNSGGIGIGGYFALTSATQRSNFTTAALIANNGTQTDPIFIGQDNGSTVFVIDDGGDVGIGTATPNSALQVAGSIATAVTTQTNATLTLDGTHDWIRCDTTSNNITISLPTAVGIEGREYNIKKIDSVTNSVTIDPSGSETIEDELTAIISIKGTSLTIRSNNSNWEVV